MFSFEGDAEDGVAPVGGARGFVNWPSEVASAIPALITAWFRERLSDVERTTGVTLSARGWEKKRKRVQGKCDILLCEVQCFVERRGEERGRGEEKTREKMKEVKRESSVKLT